MPGWPYQRVDVHATVQETVASCASDVLDVRVDSSGRATVAHTQGVLKYIRVV